MIGLLHWATPGSLGQFVVAGCHMVLSAARFTPERISRQRLSAAGTRFEQSIGLETFKLVLTGVDMHLPQKCSLASCMGHGSALGQNDFRTQCIKTFKVSYKHPLVSASQQQQVAMESTIRGLGLGYTYR